MFTRWPSPSTARDSCSSTRGHAIATATGTRSPSVAILRGAAARNPCDRGLSNLTGELSTRSKDFPTWWAVHNVRSRRTGVKKLHHLVVDDPDLTFEGMELSADPGLTLFAYTAEPGSTIRGWSQTARRLGRHPRDHRRPLTR